MPLLKKNFSERNPVTVGVYTLVGIVALSVVLFGASPVIRLLTSSSYTAVFSDAGGLQVGDDVRLNGAAVGQVDQVRLDGEHVAVEFTVPHVGRLGTATRAAIKADTVLGTRFLGVRPEGPGELPAGAVIPLERTNSPYDITQALSTLTEKSEQLDKQKLAEALDTINTTFADTPASLRVALDGVSRLSQTLGSRDEALRELLAHAQTVTGVLAKRSDNFVQVVSDGDRLLAELNQRRRLIQALLVHVTEVFDQLNGLVKDNKDQLRPALEELKDVLDLLNRNDKNLAAVIHGLNMYAGGLGEAVGGGPWFYAFIANLPPTNLVPGLPVGSGNSGLPLPGLGSGSNAAPPSSGAPSLPSLPLLGGTLPGGTAAPRTGR